MGRIFLVSVWSLFLFSCFALFWTYNIPPIPFSNIAVIVSLFCSSSSDRLLNLITGGWITEHHRGRGKEFNRGNESDGWWTQEWVVGGCKWGSWSNGSWLASCIGIATLIIMFIPVSETNLHNIYYYFLLCNFTVAYQIFP